MAANRDIRDFFELRNGFQGMIDFTDAALRFLDANGIAGSGNGHRRISAPTPKVKQATNGSLAALREQVTARFKQRKKKTKTGRKKQPHTPEPIGPLPLLEPGSMAKLKGREAVLAALKAANKPIRGVDLGAIMKAAGYKGSIVGVGVALPNLKHKGKVGQQKDGLYYAVN